VIDGIEGFFSDIDGGDSPPLTLLQSAKVNMFHSSEQWKVDAPQADLNVLYPPNQQTATQVAGLNSPAFVTARSNIINSIKGAIINQLKPCPSQDALNEMFP